MAGPYIGIEEAMALMRDSICAIGPVKDLVGARVYGSHFWDANAGTPTMPLVILEFAGGGGAYDGRIQRPEFVVWAYSDKSASEARRLYDALYGGDGDGNPGLQMGRIVSHVAGVTRQRGYAFEASRPRDGYNGTLGAWYLRGTWSAVLAG